MTVTIDIAVILGILYVSIMGIIIKILIQRDKKIKLKKYEIDLTYGTDTRVETQLDYIIDSVFDEYRLFNLEFRDNAYIKEADENKIIKDICDMVIDRISPVFITQLSTYFNTNSLGDIIAVKISTKVMEYRISRNIQGESSSKK